MRQQIDQMLHRCGGAASRGQLLEAVGRSGLDQEIRNGHLVAVFPRVYSRPWLSGDRHTVEVAAIRSSGPPSLLSHTSALGRFGLDPHALADAVHITTLACRHPRGVPGRLVVHRVSRLPARCLTTGLPTVDLATAIVQSWPLRSGPDRRGPVIAAVRDGRTDTGAVRGRLLEGPRRAGRAELADLLTLLDAGCESPLEIWGYREVFTIGPLRRGRRQFQVVVGGRRFRIDLAFEEEKVAVELDGRGYHSSDRTWERDINRDLTLATAGWLTVRLSHRRLTSDVDGCRRDVIRVLESRQGGRV
jgi:very-short-patch-repair endonuclease